MGWALRRGGGGEGPERITSPILPWTQTNQSVDRTLFAMIAPSHNVIRPGADRSARPPVPGGAMEGVAAGPRPPRVTRRRGFMRRPSFMRPRDIMRRVAPFQSGSVIDTASRRSPRFRCSSPFTL